MRYAQCLVASMLLFGATVPGALAAELQNTVVSGERVSSLSNLVRQDCGSCHGMTLRGGLGNPLLPANLAHVEADGIAGIILDGVPGTPMPPWRDLLSEADALWIARALKEGRFE